MYEHYLMSEKARDMLEESAWLLHSVSRDIDDELYRHSRDGYNVAETGGEIDLELAELMVKAARGLNNLKELAFQLSVDACKECPEYDGPCPKHDISYWE